MQNWDLDRKISVSLTRIAEFYNEFPHKIYVSFSGGKDSTVLLHLVRKLYPDTPAVFVDTGLEYPELREFVKTIDNVTWLKPEMNFRKVIETYGYPIVSKAVAKRVEEYRNGVAKGCVESTDAFKEFNGLKTMPDGNRSYFNKEKYKYLVDSDYKISYKCCNIMKHKPSYKFEKETGMKPVIGTMASESKDRLYAWKITGCNAFDSKRQISKPLSFWTEQDILAYIKRYNLTYASVYGDILQDNNGKYYTTGCNRTGCVFCGFGCHLQKEPNKFQRLKVTHPKLWDYCMRDWDKGGLGMREVLEFIGVKCE